jgi:hypothetical protein
MYQIAVVLIVVSHLVFVGYVVVGGFLAVRWRRTIGLHVPAVLWGVLIVLDDPARLDCPLTWLERRTRASAGMAPLPPEGFIAHYLTGVVYPAAWTTAVEAAVLAAVVGSWVLYGRARLRRRGYGGGHAGADHRRPAERLL